MENTGKDIDLDMGEDTPSAPLVDLDLEDVAPVPKRRKRRAPDGAARVSVTNATGGSVEWQTPRAVFDALAKLFGRDGVFALDCAATTANALCERYFTEQDNGLAQSWATDGGVAWCNPPYGHRKTRLWVRKALAEARAGNRSVLLIPARTDTIALHEAFVAARVHLLKGRIAFEGVLGADGNPVTEPAGFPSAVVEFGPHVVPGILPLDLAVAGIGKGGLQWSTAFGCL